MQRVLSFCLLLVFIVGFCGGCSLNRASDDYAFLGDSITFGWNLPRHNLGVYGQTSAQILARYPTQVHGHPYSRLYILAGTNDTWQHIDPGTTIANLSRLVDLAQADHIQPILAEIPPMFIEQGRYQPAVRELNRRIVELAQSRHVTLVDYYDAIGDRRSFSGDGVHLKRRGYLAMELALLRSSNPF
jgi:acyl-CoA thioesterase I